MGRRVKISTAIREIQREENRQLRYGKTAAPDREAQSRRSANFFIMVGIVALPIFILTLCHIKEYRNDPLMSLVLGGCIISGFLIFAGICGIFMRIRVAKKTSQRIAEEKQVLDVVNEHVRNFDTTILNANDRESIKQAIFVSLTSVGMTVKYPARGSAFGVDMIAESSKMRLCIKLVNTQKPVGIGSINQAIVGFNNYGCNELWIYSVNQQFTLNAIKEEKAHPYIKLLNKHELLSNLNRVMSINQKQ